MDDKTCQKCREAKPVEQFSKNGSRPDGLQACCKSCNAVATAAAKARDPEKVRRLANERSARWREANPDAIRESFKKWYEENQEGARERSRENHKRIRESMTEAEREAFKEAQRAYSRARYLAKQEEIKARSLARHYAKREQENERSREYYRTHGGLDRGPVMVWAGKSPAEKRASNQDARVRRLGLVPGPGSREHVIVLCSTDQSCFHCGKEMLGAAEHVDHLIPLCAGGEHTVGNLVPSCGPCNAGRRKPRRDTA